ncbi:uncharacterized protein F4822DRAFT_268478 [Hypoxylon trugodes]|uniref:uncharacterized protein n=1 Tax=Hypoxylon trugodes TaxID=326681 RepID=UPI0021921505|nr:uncharacterized protein F4822DRAFT_268478 [Hypoxylon trugodes]KAI1389070.1 hypothetical protein F4822DRAFT_268478 [Hypoxylon trugodes]
MKATDSLKYPDVMSQFPVLNSYTNYLAIFKLDDDDSREAVTSAFRVAFDEIKDKIPWIGHEIVNIDSSSSNLGRIIAKPWPIGVSRQDFFVKKYDNIMAPFKALAQANFPASMLPAEDLEPWPSLPTPPAASPAPVCALQLNFIEGGVILTISTNHTMIDGSGIISLRRVLAAVMNGEAIPDNELSILSMDRTRVIPLLAQGEPIKDHSHLLRRAPTTPPPPLEIPPARWRVFRISREAVEEIKTRARTRDSSWIPTVSHISTNDALSAFCWQRFSAVRLPLIVQRRRNKNNDETTDLHEHLLTRFGRAIDGRVAMGVPSSYMGHMVYHATLWLPMSAVATASLPFLATALRRALDEANNAWSIRSYATFLSRQTDRSRLLYGGPQNPETDFGVSSLVTAFDWERKSSLRFGPLLGEPAVWRKTDHALISGCLYFLDTEYEDCGGGDGNVVQMVLLCLPEDELDALGKDKEWTRYFKEVVEPEVNVRSKL